MWFAEHAVEKYQEGESAELKQDADLALQKARYVLQRAQEQFKDSKELYDQGYVTRIEMENDKFAEYQAGIELKKAELALEVLSKYTIPMALQEKNSDVEEARGWLERHEEGGDGLGAKAASDVSQGIRTEVVQEKLTKCATRRPRRGSSPGEGSSSTPREHFAAQTRSSNGKQVFERKASSNCPTRRHKVVIRVTKPRPDAEAGAAGHGDV